MNNYSPYQNRRPQQTAPAQAAPVRVAPAAHRAKPLPKNYVDQAEAIIQSMKAAADNDRRIKVITSTKLRNLFGLFSDSYNSCLRMESNELQDEQLSALRAARVRIVYECGREEAVKSFVEKTDMLSYLYDIGSSKEKLVNYYHYLEALVAYGRYVGLTKDEK